MVSVNDKYKGNLLGTPKLLLWYRHVRGARDRWQTAGHKKIERT